MNLEVTCPKPYSSPIPIGSLRVPFWDYLISILNISHKKELLRSLWVYPKPLRPKPEILNKRQLPPLFRDLLEIAARACRDLQSLRRW